MSKPIDIHAACRSGNLRSVQEYLAINNDVDILTEGNCTPLYIAVIHERVDIVTFLLLHGANPDLICHVGTPLHAACYPSNDDTMIRLLLSHGANINSKCRKGNTPLAYALSFRSTTIERVQFLLLNGADVHAKNDIKETPLQCLLAYSSNPDMLNIARCLVFAGADITSTNHIGRSSFFYACCKGLPEVVEFFFSRCHIPVNDMDIDSYTALHVSCDNDVIAICEMLLDNNADINALTKHGVTPLHIACSRDCISIVKFLLSRGADPNIDTVDGLLCLRYGWIHNNKELLDILLPHMNYCKMIIKPSILFGVNEYDNEKQLRDIRLIVSLMCSKYYKTSLFAKYLSVDIIRVLSVFL